ncbi:MAG: sigma-70 family RNA polymerase sigma factor [Sumerlaeia bacterium]
MTDALFHQTAPREDDASAGESAAPVDDATFARFQAGDQAAMTEVVRVLNGRVVAFARLYTHSQELAEEVAQDAFLETWRKRKKVHSASKLRPFLFTLAKRMAMREMRRKVHRVEFAIEDDALLAIAPALDAAQGDGLRQRDMMRALRQALARLSEKERDMVLLRYFAGLRIREVADALGMPMGSVGVTLQRTLDKVRRDLEHQGFALDDFV